jgi:hypothetical protein
MKNIHLIPTDKLSRYVTNYMEQNMQFQNIYITSDEKPKSGDWSLYAGCKLHKCIEDIIGDEFKKIILTTDQDLIKDGVQAIDDEFLEWFVKNPSCEEVEVSYEVLKPFESENKGYLIHCPDNELLEEPKQENCCTPIGQIKRYVDCKGCDRKPKQETLEEAASKWSLEEAQEFALSRFKNENLLLEGFVSLESILKVFKAGILTGHKFGAKWQAERMYSEEEVLELLHKRMSYTLGAEYKKETTLEWFEQFKT